MKFFSIKTSLIFLLCVGCAEKLDTGNSQVSTVVNPVTSVKSQGLAGICWAYAFTALVESEYKLRTKQDVSLSPEALWVWAVVLPYFRAKFQDAFNDKTELKPLNNDLIHSNFNSAFYNFNPSIDSGKPLDWGPETAAKYGLVPEEAFSEKVSNLGEFSLKVERMRAAGSIVLNEMLKKIEKEKSEKDKLNEKDYESSVPLPSDSEILSKVISAGFQKPFPQGKFVFSKKVYSPKEFAQNVMQFKKEKYIYSEAQSESDVEKSLQKIKQILSTGHNIAIGISISEKNLVGDRWSAGTSKGLLPFDGGHALLVTDFVNNGGNEGKLINGTVAKEVNKSISELNYLRVKNSWGVTTEKGQTVTSKDGYFKIDKDYLTSKFSNGRLGFTQMMYVAP